MDEDDEKYLSLSLLPPIAICELILFFFVWAAMHDIAHGDEGTLEWNVLAICAIVFFLLCWLALRILTRMAKMAWLLGTGLLVILFSSGAVSSMLHPKYSKDPMLGMTFLAVGVPTLGMIGYHLRREILDRRTRRNV